MKRTLLISILTLAFSIPGYSDLVTKAIRLSRSAKDEIQDTLYLSNKVWDRELGLARSSNVSHPARRADDFAIVGDDFAVVLDRTSKTRLSGAEVTQLQLSDAGQVTRVKYEVHGSSNGISTGPKDRGFGITKPVDIRRDLGAGKISHESTTVREIEPGKYLAVNYETIILSDTEVSIASLAKSDPSLRTIDIENLHKWKGRFVLPPEVKGQVVEVSYDATTKTLRFVTSEGWVYTHKTLISKSGDGVLFQLASFERLPDGVKRLIADVKIVPGTAVATTPVRGMKIEGTR